MLGYTKTQNGSVLIAVLIIVTIFLLYLISLNPIVESTVHMQVLSERSEKLNSYIDGQKESALAHITAYHSHGITYEISQTSLSATVTHNKYYATDNAHYDRGVTVDMCVKDLEMNLVKYESMSLNIDTTPDLQTIAATIPMSTSRNIVDIDCDNEGYLYVLNSDELDTSITQSITVYKITPESSYYRDVTSDSISLTEISDIDIDISGVYPTDISVKRSVNSSRNYENIVVYVSYASFSGAGQINEYIFTDNTRTTFITPAATISSFSDDYLCVSFDGNSACYAGASNQLLKYDLDALPASTNTSFAATVCIKDIINCRDSLFVLCEDTVGSACSLSYLTDTLTTKNTMNISGTNDVSKCDICFDTVYCGTYTDMKVINALDPLLPQYFCGFSNIIAVSCNNYYTFAADTKNIYCINNDLRESNFKILF